MSVGAIRTSLKLSAGTGAGVPPASSQKPVMPLFLYHSADLSSEYRKQQRSHSLMSSQRWPLARSLQQAISGWHQ